MASKVFPIPELLSYTAQFLVTDDCFAFALTNRGARAVLGGDRHLWTTVHFNMRCGEANYAATRFAIVSSGDLPFHLAVDVETRSTSLHESGADVAPLRRLLQDHLHRLRSVVYMGPKRVYQDFFHRFLLQRHLPSLKRLCAEARVSPFGWEPCDAHDITCNLPSVEILELPDCCTSFSTIFVPAASPRLHTLYCRFSRTSSIVACLEQLPNLRRFGLDVQYLQFDVHVDCVSDAFCRASIGHLQVSGLGQNGFEDRLVLPVSRLDIPSMILDFGTHIQPSSLAVFIDQPVHLRIVGLSIAFRACGPDTSSTALEVRGSNASQCVFQLNQYALRCNVIHVELDEHNMVFSMLPLPRGVRQCTYHLDEPTDDVVRGFCLPTQVGECPVVTIVGHGRRIKAGTVQAYLGSFGDSVDLQFVDFVICE